MGELSSKRFVGESQKFLKKRNTLKVENKIASKTVYLKVYSHIFTVNIMRRAVQGWTPLDISAFVQGRKM